MAVISPVGVPSHVCAAAYALIAPLDGSVFVGCTGFVSVGWPVSADWPESGSVGWLVCVSVGWPVPVDLPGSVSVGWLEVVSELSLVGCCCVGVVVAFACACGIGAVANPRHKAAIQVVATAATQ